MMKAADKYERFITAVIAIAKEKGITPDEAIGCFGRAGALLVKGAEDREGVPPDEGMKMVMESFMDGVSSVYPIHFQAIDVSKEPKH